MMNKLDELCRKIPSFVIFNGMCDFDLPVVIFQDLHSSAIESDHGMLKLFVVFLCQVYRPDP